MQHCERALALAVARQGWSFSSSSAGGVPGPGSPGRGRRGGGPLGRPWADLGHSDFVPGAPKWSKMHVRTPSQSATSDVLLNLCKNMPSQGPSKWSKLYYSHENIAIFAGCPESPKCHQKVSKKLQNETLGLPESPKVEPSGTLRTPTGT